MVLILQLLQFAGFLMDNLPRSLQKSEQQLLPRLLSDDVKFVVMPECSRHLFIRHVHPILEGERTGEVE